MTAPIAAVSPASTAPASAPPVKPEPGLSFHAVLSALNPLQYLPVIGTIYRAVTGDVIPEPVRRIGSLVVSGLMGGPVGVAINIATMAAEKISGIDLDRTGQAMLHGESLHQAVAGQSAPDVHRQAVADQPAAPAEAAEPAPRVSSAAQLAAYGAPWGSSGMPTRDDLHSADALNALELRHLHTVHAAYAQTAALVP